MRASARVIRVAPCRWPENVDRVAVSSRAKLNAAVRGAQATSRDFFFVWEKVANRSPSFSGTAASKKLACIFFVPTSPGLRRRNGSCMIRSFASCRGNTAASRLPQFTHCGAPLAKLAALRNPPPSFHAFSMSRVGALSGRCFRHVEEG